jgi:hypothetical protein
MRIAISEVVEFEMGVPAALKPPRDATLNYIAEKKLWGAVADACGIQEGAVRLWRQVPAKRVLHVERALGRPRHLIRPDLYGKLPPRKRVNHGEESKRQPE